MTIHHTAVEKVTNEQQAYPFSHIGIGDAFEFDGTLFIRQSYAIGIMVGRGANIYDSAQARTFSMEDIVKPVELIRYKTV